MRQRIHLHNKFQAWKPPGNMEPTNNLCACMRVVKGENDNKRKKKEQRQQKLRRKKGSHRMRPFLETAHNTQFLERSFQGRGDKRCYPQALDGDTVRARNEWAGAPREPCQQVDKSIRNSLRTRSHT